MYLALTNTTRQKFVSFGPTTVRRIHGVNNSANDAWIQLHQKIPDSIATPLATGNVPAYKSLYCAAGQAFVFYFGEPGSFFNPLVFGVSSTETSFTDAGSNNGLDCTIEYDTLYATNGNETITGDLTTGVDAINPWTDAVANDGKRLIRVDYINNDGATRFLLLSTDAGVSNLASFIYQVTNGSTLTLEFGVQGGLYTFSQDSSFLPHYGCRILQSTSASVAGLTSSAASNIKALWR